jgi:hypothetical protein
MRHIYLPAAVAALLAGCAGGMSQSECQFSDWHAVGYEDGSAGRSTGRFGQYRKSCAEHGVAADFQAYQAGREAGLREYCQASRGYQEGARGASYAGVCPADLEPRFLDAYNDGHTLYELESGLRETDYRLRADQARINNIELELTSNATAMLTEITTVEERARLLVQTKQLVEERTMLAGEIKQLQGRRITQEADLAAYQAEQVSKR